MPLYSVSGIGEKVDWKSLEAQGIAHNAMISAGCEDEAVRQFSREFETAHPGFTVRKVDVFQVAPPPDLHSI